MLESAVFAVLSSCYNFFCSPGNPPRGHDTGDAAGIVEGYSAQAGAGGAIGAIDAAGALIEKSGAPHLRSSGVAIGVLTFKLRGAPSVQSSILGVPG